MWDGFDWYIGAMSALVGFVCVLLVRSSSRWRGLFLRLAVFVVAVTATLGYFRWMADRDLTADRRALQVRQADLAARALVPGSPLACLDGDAGEAVETACEKVLFAKPETTAAAVTYVTARLSLLRDALSLGDDELEPMVAGLRRALELDRYGIAAHVLANRDGCNVETCAAFAWAGDPTALKANLKARAFDGYVQRYEDAWKNEGEAKSPAVASAAPAPGNDPSAEGPGHAPVSSRYDFPSAASIPPVSIMNKEPPRPPEGAAVAAQPESQSSETAPAPQLPIPPKRPQTQGAAPQ
jgi:hypothetical protein